LIIFAFNNPSAPNGFGNTSPLNCTKLQLDQRFFDGDSDLIDVFKQQMNQIGALTREVGALFGKTQILTEIQQNTTTTEVIGKGNTLIELRSRDLESKLP
jgi:hypothetical protein